MLATAGALAAALWITACQPAQQPQQQAQTDTQSSAQTETNLVERGKYLVTVAACDECHTPFKTGANGPERDMSRRLSGHPQGTKLSTPKFGAKGWAVAIDETGTAFFGPWGIAFAANLTPDEETGIGIWDEQMFINAIRTGKHWGQGRPIAPIMPWHNYAQMTDEDLKAIFAYLKSLPPIKNEVPELIPPPGTKTE
ncbi:MAG: c-type cytochrome [Chthonomonadetes bacterium]|nr:c-type cytochrome [Chthonomonadetes bacterium]